MDRNTITGFALLAVLLVTYITYNNYSQKEFEKKKVADSVAYAKAHPPAPIDSARIKAIAAATPADTQDSISKAALPPAFRGGEAQTVMLENKDIALQFSTKGANPTSAKLKDYKTYSGSISLTAQAMHFLHSFPPVQRRLPRPTFCSQPGSKAPRK